MTLVRQRLSENNTWVDLFLVDPKYQTRQEVQAAMRNAADEYLSTEDGQKYNESINQDFNWGDAVANVPNDIWQKHGLCLVDALSCIEVMVNQDEVFSVEEPLSKFLNNQNIGKNSKP